MLTSIALASLLTSANADKWEIESLGEPCRARQVLAGRLVRDRKSGREVFALANMNENSRAELIFIDPETQKGQVFRAPKGAGSWALREVEGDRLVVGTFYDGQFMVFDLKKRAFIQSVGFPGESYIWNLALGGDGRIYGGTYPGGKLGALDLKTYQVEDLGAPAPPNLYLRTVSALPDGRILCSFITEKPVTQIFDPKTKRFSPVPKVLEGVTSGAVWNGYFVAGNRAFHKETLEPVEPLPFPAEPRGGWAVDITLTDEKTLYLRQGNALFRYRTGESSLTRVAEIDLRGGVLYAASSSGALFGVRGQDYFVLKPDDKEVRLRFIPGDSAPRAIHFLKIDPKGTLWGGPPFGQTLFSLNPKTKKAKNTPTVSDSGGEVYDATFYQGAVYAAAYAGGEIVRYAPREKWDQWGKTNPRTLVSLGARGYIRPTGGILVGEDSRLYSGWMAGYGRYGGAVAITDPKTGQTDLIENPLGEQAIEGLAVLGGFAYVGTSLSANGLPDKPKEAPRFGILDLATRKVVFQQEFAGGGSVRQIVADPKTQRLAMIVKGRLRVFDLALRRFAEIPEIPVSSATISAPGEGNLYFGSGKALHALNLKTGETTLLAELPANIRQVTATPKGAIFVGCGTEVFCVRRSAGAPKIEGE